MQVGFPPRFEAEHANRPLQKCFTSMLWHHASGWVHFRVIAAPETDFRASLDRRRRRFCLLWACLYYGQINMAPCEFAPSAFGPAPTSVFLCLYRCSSNPQCTKCMSNACHDGLCPDAAVLVLERTEELSFSAIARTPCMSASLLLSPHFVLVLFEAKLVSLQNMTSQPCALILKASM